MGEKFQAVARCFQKPGDKPIFNLQTVINFPIWTVQVFLAVLWS